MIINLAESIGLYLDSVVKALNPRDSMATAIFMLTLAGYLGWLGRALPRHILSYTQRLTTISVQFEDSWESPMRAAMETAASFIAKHQVKRKFRLLSVKRVRDNYNFASGPQTISGMFFIGFRPFWYSSEDGKEQGAVKARITITTLGRNQQDIFDAIELEKGIRTTRDKRMYYVNDGKAWSSVGDIRSTASLFLPKATKEKLDKAIDFFRDNEEWYYARGINRKLLIILHGLPGGGKSSISGYVASRMNWSLGTVGTTIGFSKAIRDAAESNIVVSVPDVDTLGIGLKRSGIDNSSRRYRPDSQEGDSPGIDSSDDQIPMKFDSNGDIVSDSLDEEGKSTTPSIADKLDAISLDKILNEALNLFQGDIPLNDAVVVMSTNCLDALDPALLRSSRCDLLLEIGPLGPEEIQEFYSHYYENSEDIRDQFTGKRIIASDLMGAFTDNPFDSNTFLETIKTKVF